MRPQQQTFLLFRVEVFFDEIGPKSSGRPHFGDFHVEIHSDAPEEGETRRKVVNVQTGFHASPTIPECGFSGEGRGERRV